MNVPGTTSETRFVVSSEMTGFGDRERKNEERNEKETVRRGERGERVGYIRQRKFPASEWSLHNFPAPWFPYMLQMLGGDSLSTGLCWFKSIHTINGFITHL